MNLDRLQMHVCFFALTNHIDPIWGSQIDFRQAFLTWCVSLKMVSPWFQVKFPGELFDHATGVAFWTVDWVDFWILTLDWFSNHIGWLVVTGCHEFYFPINIGFLSSSQLTKSYFSVAQKPPTSVCIVIPRNPHGWHWFVGGGGASNS